MLKMLAKGLSAKHVVILNYSYSKSPPSPQGLAGDDGVKGDSGKPGPVVSTGPAPAKLPWERGLVASCDEAAEPVAARAGAVCHPGGGHRVSCASPRAGPCLLGPALQCLCNRVIVFVVSLEPKLLKGILIQLLKPVQKRRSRCAINAWLSDSA